MLETRFERYDSSYCFDQFEKTSPQIIDGEAIVVFELNEHEFEVYMPLESEQPDPVSMELARDAMRNLTKLDNLVQQSSADECERTGIAAANYDPYLAYATISKPEIMLRYYGSHVNTEWDAIFEETDHGWEKVNF